jgi:hypothetical protein
VIQKIVDESAELRPGTVTVAGVRAFPSGHRQVNGWIDHQRADGISQKIDWSLLLRERARGEYEPAHARIDNGSTGTIRLEHEATNE